MCEGPNGRHKQMKGCGSESNGCQLVVEGGVFTLGGTWTGNK